VLCVRSSELCEEGPLIPRAADPVRNRSPRPGPWGVRAVRAATRCTVEIREPSREADRYVREAFLRGAVPGSQFAEGHRAPRPACCSCALTLNKLVLVQLRAEPQESSLGLGRRDRRPWNGADSAVNQRSADPGRIGPWCWLSCRPAPGRLREALGENGGQATVGGRPAAKDAYSTESSPQAPGPEARPSRYPTLLTQAATGLMLRGPRRKTT